MNNTRTNILALFEPAAKLLGRLRFIYKFAVLGVILVASLVYLGLLQFRTVTEQKEFNRAEADGTRYITAAEAFTDVLQQHRVASVAILSGAESLRPLLAAIESDGDSKLAAVEVEDTRYGDELKTSARWRELTAGWAQVKAQAFPDAAASEAAHALLAGKAIDWILNQAGNNSNLILDPDLDSYWLMDAFVVKVPAVSDLVASLATRSLLPGETVERLTALAGGYRGLVDNVTALNTVNLKTVLAESTNPKWGQKPDIKEKLEGPFRQATEQLNAFAEAIRASFSAAPAAGGGAGGAAAAPTRHSAAGAARLASDAIAAIKASGRLHAAITPELAWLVDKRVNRYSGSRTQGVVAGVSFTLLLVYLLVGLFVSVGRSTRTLKEATNRMIAGTEEEFVSPSRDELGDVAIDYNSINAALVQSRKLQYRVQQDNEELQGNIMELLQVVSEASEGDLRVRARIGAGALGNLADALNSLFESLQTLLGDVNKQVEATNETVARITDAARSMSDGATKQAQEVMAAVRMVETMSTKINMVSENAGRAANAAIGTRTSAQEGAQAIMAVISGMEQLRANVQAGAKKMKNLGDRSMEITSIVETISRISEQTNMLALNAAIEAARAGEHGRGFSVVAEQVGKLADRAAVATQEIDKIIKSIHGETTDTVQAIEQQTAVVEKQGQVVSTAGSSLEKIREVSTESAALVTDISAVAKAQVDGTRSVVSTMEQISKIARSTQEGAAGTVQTVRDLVQRSEKLTASIRRFKTAA